MTQPDYVPILASDRVRPSDRLSLPGRWDSTRPADLVGMVAPSGPSFGSPGPNLGYGLKLARRFADRLELVEGESRQDAIAGGFAAAARRAASFGRAPVIGDLTWAYTLWGYLGGAPADLVAARVGFIRGAAHHYSDQRRVADSVAIGTLRLTAEEVRGRLGQWRTLVRVP